MALSGDWQAVNEEQPEEEHIPLHNNEASESADSEDCFPVD